MTYPQKVDGFGTRYIGPDRIVNIDERQKFVRLFASEDIAKGDVVCFDFKNTEPANGYGNHVLIADSNVTTDGCELRSAIGVAAEAIASGDIGRIQVAGVCDFAKATIANCAPGEPVTVHTDPGELTVAASVEDVVVGIYIKDGSDGTASSSVYLVNPANL